MDPFHSLPPSSSCVGGHNSSPERSLEENFHTYLHALSAEQKQSVSYTKGPILILAGAGSGKTRVLTAKIAQAFFKEKSDPSHILAVTFTNKAADDMKKRLFSLMGPGARNLFLGTFHSIGLRILQKHGTLLGLDKNFTIFGYDDQIRLIKQIMKLEGVDDKTLPPKIVVATISRWKDKALFPEDVAEENRPPIFHGKQSNHHTIKNLYKIYEKNLRLLNAVDFGDLLLLNLRLFHSFPDVGREYQQQFRYIFVDEYQDTNESQYRWLRFLATTHQNICCVGDDDQSIYGWRGADVGNLLNFSKDFPLALTFRLEENYRSTPLILDAANALIQHNVKRMGKTSKAIREGGEKVHVQGNENGAQEARWLCQTIQKLRKNLPLSHMVILVRANFQTREIEERLLSENIAYRIVGSLRFYERAEIRDVVAYLRVVVQPYDTLALERILNVPKRGLGLQAQRLLRETATQHGCSFVDAMSHIAQNSTIQSRFRLGFERLFHLFQGWSALSLQASLSHLVEKILEESGYKEALKKEGSAESLGRLENLKELVKAVEDFQNPQEFLEHIALVTEKNTQDTQDMLSVMTLHTAKGLEFDTVFLAGWEEGIFPHPRALEENGNKGLEEERRLAYVGLTRAKNQAFISFAWNRRLRQGWQNAMPSRFIDEIPSQYTHRSPHHTHQQPGAFFHKPPPQKPPPKHPSGPSGPFFKTQQVVHEKFGYGIVQNVWNDTLEIFFDNIGTKKIISRFVKPI